MTIALRQPVVAVRDLSAGVAEWRSALGLGPGARDADMATFGLDHEVLGVGAETFIEVVAPIRDDAAVAHLLERAGGDCGYMLALHIRDADVQAFHARVAANGYRVVMTSSYLGSDIVQLHPREFGTLLQVSHTDRPWHWLESVGRHTTGTVADEITAVQIAVDDPAAMASKWATLLGIEADATTLPLDQGTIEFVPATGPAGFVGVTVSAADRSQAGNRLRLSGITVTFA